jgi:hypothetical protein
VIEEDRTFGKFAEGAGTQREDDATVISWDRAVSSA